jgi:hypothetical protein
MFHHCRTTAGSSVITRGETSGSVLDYFDLADAFFLSWLQTVNVFSKHDLTNWALMFVG